MTVERDAWDAVRRAGGLVAGLSARLLALVLASVVVVAALVFVPSVAAFHTAWLAERVDAARLATLAVEAAPDLEVSDEMAERLLSQAQVRAVAVRRDGQRELILGTVAPPEPPVRIEMQGRGPVASALQVLQAYATPPDRYLLIVDSTRMRGVEYIEVLVPSEPLKEALLGFTGRALLMTLLASAIVGAVLYAALAVLFVAPMRRLARNMARFREAPEDPTRVIAPSGRHDEIGEAEAALADLQARVRDALRQKARLAALGEAVAKINHDLRNVLSNAQLVSDRLAQSSDPQVRAQGEKLVRSIDRGVRLAEDVLAFGRPDERPPAAVPIALRALLEEAFQDASSAAAQAMELALELDAEARVVGDAELLHRVFVNLMRNAVLATASQQGRNAPGLLTIAAVAADGFLAVTVADDGPGIPPRTQERLFQPFATSSSRNGAGLGLAIARELARAQGGDVTLVTTSAQGTVFEVRLRRA